MNRYGFTLIEVIIAMLILSFISLFTVQSIQRALQTKVKVQKDIDKNASVRDALRIMERDINMAFNYHDVNIALYNMAQKARQQKATPNAPPPPGGAGPPPTVNAADAPGAAPAAPPDGSKYPLKTEKIYTQFIGEPQSLTFTSLSNVRMMEESPISSQAEIGYKLKPCRRRSNQEQSSQCLWRRVANYFHDDITREDGQETVLLENVKEFKLRYLGPGRGDEWVDTWITDDRGDDQTKGRFPYAVEITLDVKDPNPKAKDKSLRLTAVAAISNPNNPYDPAKDGENNNGTDNPQGTATAPPTGQPGAPGQPAVPGAQQRPPNTPPPPGH